MNNFNMNDSRNRRNLLNWSGFFPFHSVTNYASNSSKIKIDMKNSFGDPLYINNLHLIPDPLKKNLADSIITQVTTKTNMASETHFESKLKENNSADYHTDSYLPLGFITSFISGVFSFVSSVVFHKRTNPTTQYYECYEKNYDESVPSLQAWQHAKPEDQNKNGWAHNFIHSTNESSKTTDELNINTNSKSALLCDDNLNQVCLLLSNDSPTQYQSRQQSGQQNMFVESNSTEDCFEDAFTSEDFENLPDDDSCLELYNSLSQLNPEFLVSDAPRTRSEYVSISEPIEIVNSLPDILSNKESNVSAPDKDDLGENVYSKANIVVSSCEDKMNKLKALLQKCQKDKTNTDNYTNIIGKPLKQNEFKTEPIFIPNTIDLNSTVENIFKEYTIKKAISPKELYSEDIIKDINKDVQTKLTESQCSNAMSEYLAPSNYFDEVTGRFYSTSADSEDSFQIVFDDSPKSCRRQITSECESEDSFIIFDDTPDSCYSSNDVFGDELNITGYDFIESSDSESSDDSDSDSESDSGCDTYTFTCKLSHSLTRTIGDLTDDTLYNMDKDEVDCAARFVEEKPLEVISDLLNMDNTSETETKPRGLLLDDKRKLEKKKQPSKTVRFSSNPPKVHVMRVWAFAARQARAGHWERHALDRERFKRRIADVDMAVSWVLKPQHRARVMFQRFMPWWNAQRRNELAEMKQREEEEKSAEVKEISPDLPEVTTKSDSSVDNTNVGNNNPNQEIYKNQDADISKKSHLCDVTTEHLTSNGKILLDNSKTNGLKHGLQNNNVGVST